ncbi:hypothetical protein DBA29_17215 [Xenophilus aerolatus]|nr:hypothetical protein [Xenophilus aerolatus]
MIPSTPRPALVPAIPGTKPVGGLMDRRFKYVPACATDIRKTIKRAQAAQRRADADDRQGSLL